MTAETFDLLDLIAGLNTDPAPLRVDERDRIVDDWRTDAAAHDGIVDPNRVRALLSNAHGLTVRPQRLAAMYHSPLLEPCGEVRSDDTAGRNRGTVLGLYRFREGA